MRPAGPSTLAPVRAARSLTSPTWSPWPWVTRITSTLPSASRFLYCGGVFGLLVRNGSITITLPVGVVSLVVACPSQWTSTLAVWAHATSVAIENVRAPAASLSKSRRSSSMVDPPRSRRLGLERLGKKPGAALPRVGRGFRVVRRPVVGEEAVAGAGVDHDLGVGIGLLEHLAELLRVLRRRSRVLLPVHAEERHLDVLDDIEPGHRIRR